jgi:anti-anti-sigma regulatory factor
MLKLPAELTIAHVAECKDKILKIIDESDEIILDDSAVVRIDTIGLQMLLAAVTYISAQSKSLKWKCQSNAIKESVALLGLEEPILNQYLV